MPIKVGSFKQHLKDTLACFSKPLATLHDPDLDEASFPLDGPKDPVELVARECCRRFTFDAVEADVGWRDDADLSPFDQLGHRAASEISRLAEVHFTKFHGEVVSKIWETFEEMFPERLRPLIAPQKDPITHHFDLPLQRCVGRTRDRVGDMITILCADLEEKICAFEEVSFTLHAPSNFFSAARYHPQTCVSLLKRGPSRLQEDRRMLL